MVNKSADELAKQANGNVESKNLTEDGGMVRTYLYDGPLINHINEGEQPHYVFSHISSGLKILDESGEEQKTLEYSEGLNGKTYLTITDSRIIYVSGIKGGDQLLEWDYSEIKAVNKSEEWKHSLDNLDFSVDDAEDASTILFATSDEVYAFAQVMTIWAA